MTDLTKEQLETLITETCPKCAEGWPLVWEKPYSQWMHQRHNHGSISTTICMATNLRVKYKDLLGE